MPIHFALALGLALATPIQPPADLILENARVYTFDWPDPGRDGKTATEAPRFAAGWAPDAAAVAIVDGRILAVGSREAVEKYRGPSTRVVDLGGATLLPGLVDSHTHVAELGAKLQSVDLTGVPDEATAVEKVAAFAATVPAGEWIVGRGWDEGAWADRYPTLEMLSRRVPDHPVVLASLHGFAVWANRRALDALGITAATVAPVGGEIRRDATGGPTGIFLNRATELLLNAVPPPAPARYEAQVKAGLEAMAQAGYVAIHEAGVDRRLLDAFLALERRGELPVRVYVMLSARDGDLCREWLKRGPKVDGLVIVRAVKAYYDGALGSRGARLLADYADRPGHRGVAGENYGFDRALVAAMVKAGFQVGIHAIGDAGNRETLDYLEGIFRDAPTARAGRHRVEHAQVLAPADIPRFAALGVTASMEPPHAVEDKPWAETRLGAERVKGAYAWRTLRKAGAHLIFNSDLAGSDHDIFYGLHAAITRRDKQKQPPGGWYPEERLTPEEALRAYSSWAAWSAFEEDATGKIAVGRRADLSVFDLDPLVVGETDPGKLLDGRIMLTVVGGRIVFASKSEP